VAWAGEILVHVLKLRLIAGALLASALGGCVTHNNTLRPEDVANFKFAGVSVKVKPGLYANWDEGYRAYAASKKIPDHELATASNGDDAKAYVGGLAAAKVKDAMERQMAGALTGSRPVRIEVLVTGLEISSAVQRVVIGGSNQLSADITLVDAKSGAVIIERPSLFSVVGAGNGVLGAAIQAAYDAANGPPIDRLANDLSEKYKTWLINEAGGKKS
jgi:hypothetical protein